MFLILVILFRCFVIAQITGPPLYVCTVNNEDQCC